MITAAALGELQCAWMQQQAAGDMQAQATIRHLQLAKLSLT